MINLVSIPALGLSVRPDAIEAIRFNLEETTSLSVSEDRVANPMLNSVKTSSIVATVRFPGELRKFILNEDENDNEGSDEKSSDEKNESEEPYAVFEVAITLKTFESNLSDPIPFFQSPQYTTIIEILSAAVEEAEESYNSASKKDKEAKFALLEKAKKQLASAQKSPVSMITNINTIETAQTQKSHFAPVKTTYVDPMLTPSDDEEDVVVNPMEAQVNALNEQIAKATRMFDNKISFFNSLLTKKSEIEVSAITPDTVISGKSYTMNDLLKLVIV